jgi:hypothetical protein
MFTAKIIRKFGTQTDAVAVAGVGQSVVSKWIKADQIPGKRQRILLKAAKKQEIDLKAADFFDDDLD